MILPRMSSSGSIVPKACLWVSRTAEHTYRPPTKGCTTGMKADFSREVDASIQTNKSSVKKTGFLDSGSGVSVIRDNTYHGL